MLDLYANKGSALPQKLTITALELGFIALSYFILFGDGDAIISSLFGWPVLENTPARRGIILAFNLIILARMGVMMFVFLKRQIPWSEALSVPVAFAIYYVGFAILVLPNSAPLGTFDYVGIGIFALGCILNTVSEWQRHIFKSDPANKGKLFTGGLFAYSMHINFFGDVLWVLGYAMIAGHLFGYALPILLLSFFAFFNVPKLDDYLRARYGQPFENYETATKRLIPFVW